MDRHGQTILKRCLVLTCGMVLFPNVVSPQAMAPTTRYLMPVSSVTAYVPGGVLLLQTNALGTILFLAKQYVPYKAMTPARFSIVLSLK